MVYFPYMQNPNSKHFNLPFKNYNDVITQFSPWGHTPRFATDFSRSYCNTVGSAFGIILSSVCLSVCLSVRLSVTLCFVAFRVGVQG